MLDESRLVLKANVKKDETINVDKKKTESYGTDYQFKFMKKWDVATTYNITRSRQDNLVSALLSNESDTKNYSIQTRIPRGNWA